MRFQPFVYEKENFVESTAIYPTDIVAFLNRSQKKMYLWAGKQANGASVAEARSIWSSFAKKYAEFDAFDLTAGKEATDFELSKEIRSLLGQHEEEISAQKKRNLFQSVASTASLLGIVSFFLVALNAILLLFSPNISTGMVILENSLASFFTFSLIALIVAIMCLAIGCIMAISAKNSSLAVVCILAVGVGVGFFVYLNQGEFLFYFQNYATIPGTLVLAYPDLLIFVLINLIAFAGACVPVIIQIRPHLQTAAGKIRNAYLTRFSEDGEDSLKVVEESVPPSL